MKLDNRGWGLSTVLIIIAVFAIAVFISFCVYQRTFGKNGIIDYKSTMQNDTKVSSNISYSQYENRIKEGTEKYLKDNDIDLDDGETFTITLNQLVTKKYMNPISINNEVCSGYARVEKENVIVPYLKCSSYTTAGYVSELDD